MPAPVPRRPLRDRLRRSLLPTLGARANAADSLEDLQQTCRAHAEAAEASARALHLAPAARREAATRSAR